MKELSHIVVWACRADRADEERHRFAKLVKQLSTLGYDLEWVTAPSPMTSQWVTDRLPATTRFLFVSDVDPVWVGDVQEALQTAQSPIPLIWVHDVCPSTLLEYMTTAGVADILSADAPPSDLGLRLRLRRRQVEHAMALERQLKEQRLKTAKSETAVKQREEFLSVCAHDLRSPLGLIQSSLAMILNSEAAKPTLSELHTDLLTRAKRQATQALRLVHDLLDVMAFEQGFKPRYQLLNLDDLLGEFYKDYTFQAEEKGVKFHYTNAISDWRVVADAERIRQLLQNLFMNALKFTDQGKNIYLSVAPFQGRRRVDPPHPMIVISIRDEGRGIPQKEIQRIFDRFTQVRDYNRAEGRGLGLTVAKQISTLHDGNIWVQSEEGKGSTFFVLFPHVVSRTSFEPKASTGRTILVAEPATEKRENVFGILRRWGYEVVFAKDAIELVTSLFFLMPDAVIITPGLAKMSDEEIANLIKNDPATSSLPLMLALEPGQRTDRELETILVDHRLEIPFTKEHFEQALKDIRSRHAKKGKEAA